MCRFLFVKFQICIIITNSSVGNISLSLPNLWEIHNCLHLDWVKYIMVYNSPVGCTAFSLPTMRDMKYFLQLIYGKFPLSVLLLWKIHQCLNLTHEKCSSVSTCPVENTCLSSPHPLELHHCATSPEGNASSILPNL